MEKQRNKIILQKNSVGGHETGAKLGLCPPSGPV